jgi:hypothetical protein
MKMLIAIAGAQRGHIHHPKTISECSDLAGRLFEAVFELEAQAIETNDLDSAQGEICAHQQPRTRVDE